MLFLIKHVFILKFLKFSNLVQNQYQQDVYKQEIFVQNENEDLGINSMLV